MTKSSSTYQLYSNCVGSMTPVKWGATVLIGAQPALRIGVQEAHGEVIIVGFQHVLIGGKNNLNNE